MWEDFFFYLKATKPVGANLCRRLSTGMADLGFNLKRRLSRAVRTEPEMEKHYLEVISETPEVEETKPQISQRPLPLPPVETKCEVTSMPWYKNVDREGSEELLKTGVDGYFLIRPSSQVDTYLVLSLSYKNTVYNIPIRKKRDGRFALGTPRARERCFESVEYMIKYFQSEKLVIICNGMRVGKTVLTVYPP